MADYRDRGLTNGYLPEAAFLHLAPTAVGFVDLDETLELRQAPTSTGPADCRDAILLVRMHDEPLAIIHSYESLEHASAASLSVAIWDQCAEEIRAHCEHFGCCSAPRSAGDLVAGLSARPGPCPGARRQHPGGSVTVVIPTAARPRKLERCLSSLCALDYKDDFDVVVVDNRPERPGTEEAVAAFADRLNVRYVAEPRPGSSVARNRGVAETAADFVAFADDDVVLDPGWLGWLLDPLADSRVSVSASMILPLELQTESQKRFEQYAGFSKGVTMHTYDLTANRARDRVLYPYWGGVCGSGIMAFRRAEFVSAGGFDPALGAGTPARAGEDIDAFTTAILRGGQVVYQPRALSWHEHKREADVLRRTLFDYGVGFSAVLTKHVRESGFQAALFRSIPLLLRRNRRSDASARLPRSLARVERWGMLRGPLLYARSRKWANTLRLDDVIKQP
jgi:O-antigen biosynthesis protein